MRSISARERLPLSATLRFNSTLQCGRCLGCLHPHNPRGRNVAVSAFVLVSNLVFSPRDLHYRVTLLLLLSVVIIHVSSNV